MLLSRCDLIFPHGIWVGSLEVGEEKKDKGHGEGRHMYNEIKV